MRKWRLFFIKKILSAYLGKNLFLNFPVSVLRFFCKNPPSLSTDENIDVRCAVVRQKRPQDLDILVHDESWFVRYAVAEHNRSQDLEVLKNDPDPDVAQYTKRKLELKK